MDTIVVGAGVVGLATARALALRGRDVVVVEAEPSFGWHASSRNSEVIHAGIYYAPQSLKARLCIAGKDRLRAYCRQSGVRTASIGKLIVATHHDELPALEAIALNASQCGMDALQVLDAAAAKQLEPALNAVAALFSPTTGIVDSHGLMRQLMTDIEAMGGTFAWATRIVAAEFRGDCFAVRTQSETVRCRALVNAAGHGAQGLATAIRGLDPASVPPRHLVKGSYFTLRVKCPFRHLIYPTPASASLGIHLTLDLEGRARFGPDQEWVDELAYDVDPLRAPTFATSIRRYWPALPHDALVPDYAGVRVRVRNQGPADFVIQGPQEHGVPGLVNLFGIESPGLTACLPLADEVVARLVEC